MLDPAGHVAALRIAMRPVDDAAALVPFVLAIELDRVAGLDRSNTIGQIDVVGHQHRLPGSQLNYESLVPAPFVVVGKDPADAAASLDLNVTPATLECCYQCLIGTAGTRVSVLLPRDEPAFDAAEVDGRQDDSYDAPAFSWTLITPLLRSRLNCVCETARRTLEPRSCRRLSTAPLTRGRRHPGLSM